MQTLKGEPMKPIGSYGNDKNHTPCLVHPDEFFNQLNNLVIQTAYIKYIDPRFHYYTSVKLGLEKAE
jgi:hypothetical protein